MATTSRAKYKSALDSLKPIRLKKRSNNECPIHNVGLLSYMSVHWLTQFMWKSYKLGTVDYEELWKCPYQESSDCNQNRFEKLWNDEVRRNGLEKASLSWTLVRFIRTRLIVGVLVNICTISFSFIGPTIFYRALLDYINSEEDDITHGLLITAILFVVEILRILTFVTVWLISYEMAIRAKSGIMTLLYAKVLRLRTLGDKSVGEVINLFSNDSQRVFDAVSLAPLLLGSPLMAIGATIYCVYILGPWALLGSVVIALFYPYQLLISKVTTRLRRKSIQITDKRVRVMSEILSCIKLIKLYAWEKSFARCIAGIRQEERRMLQHMAYVQTLSIAFTPMVPVFAAVAAFTAHTLAGNDLSVTQAFVVLTVLHRAKRCCTVLQLGSRSLPMACVAIKRVKAFVIIAVYLRVRLALAQLNYIKALGDLVSVLERFKTFVVFALYMLSMKKLAVLPYSIKSRAECKVTLKRIKNILIMEEVGPKKLTVPMPSDYVIDINGGSFAWEHVKDDQKTVSEKSYSNRVKICRKGTSEEMSQLRQESKIVRSTNILLDINIKVKKAELLGICGSVGCGKSSLLSAILGLMIKTAGQVSSAGSIAYVPQQAWILNETMKENIIFGENFEQDRYEDVLERCCLNADIKALPAGDQTEIGERGINLSGGQKQRVSLARALYSNRDIYLLDDPLSAVDPHVGQFIFEHCIQGILKKKTVVFVTHQLQYLNQCDQVILLKDGKLIEKGNHFQLVKENGEYASLVTTYHMQLSEALCDSLLDSGGEISSFPSFMFVTELKWTGARHPGAECLTPDKSASCQSNGGLSFQYTHEATPQLKNTPAHIGKSVSFHNSISSITSQTLSTDEPLSQQLIEEKDTSKLSEAKLIVAEEVWKGAVSWKSYHKYFQAAGGLCFCGFVLFTFSLPVGCSAFANFWLSYWLNQGSGNNQTLKEDINKTGTTHYGKISDNPDLGFYIFIYAAAALSVVVTTLIRGFLFMRATLKASSSLHDKVFLKIMRSPMSFFDTTPIGRTLNRFSRDLDEVDVRLPFRSEQFLQNLFLVMMSLIIVAVVFPWFLVAVVPLILVFGLLNKMYRVVLRQVKRAENVSRSPLFSHIATSVQGLQTIHAYNKQEEFLDKFKRQFDMNTMPSFLFYCCMRWLAFRLDVLTTVIITITSFMIIMTKGEIPPAFAGLALVYASQITGLFQFTIRLASETEAHFTSVERIQYYIDNIETEAPAIIPTNRPELHWPNDGRISFKQYSMQYRPGLPFVLSGIDCDIRSKEKIGVVGRTGSGKSSLALALFRVVEASNGSIEIDNLDVSSIGLEDLRSKLSIIPQDPVLFAGNIRYNLDPFSQHCDDTLWEALDKCHVKSSIVSLEGQLDAPVIENGENFSVGERQLICMARALLRHSKILILDEATASIDTETDSKVQATLKEAFDKCTMLIIAHRLNTVLSCDRIMVLEGGEIMEFDQPARLLENTHSILRGMVLASELPNAISTAS